ncbi:hypothetical protein BU15DRAFT_90696 [Melanogaster broomeanus]|nr:hypothetical protein BU15DRAFT_90696 [Melanogaster broomeanus]
MRASMSHKFGREYALGTEPWKEHSTIPGRFTGNPSLSVTVSQYMISLHRRKVRLGEVVTSARAMDEPIMIRLWEFACQTPQKDFGPTTRQQKADDPTEWAGFNIRMMLYLLYLVSMTCLLRYDEALRMTWADVAFQNPRPTDFRVKLNLPFRKTHQYGDIAPFYLYGQPNRPWMCLVTAFAIWWNSRQKVQNLDGFVFRKKIGTDSTSQSFLECFRNNLLDIGIDPRPYGTHSFRRGGCQYLHIVLKWSFRQICNWGGWADDCDNPGTIFKYLLSWNDSPDRDRENYMNPARPLTDPCRACGRTCHCA